MNIMLLSLPPGWLWRFLAAVSVILAALATVATVATAATIATTAIAVTPAAADTPGTPVLTPDPGTHTAAIRQIAVDPAERVLVTASDDKTARLWDIATGRLLGTLHVPVAGGSTGRLYAAAVSPQGRLALAGTTAGAGGIHRIYLYDLGSRAFVKSLNARGGDIKRLQWSPDGKLLAAAYAGDPALRVFDDEGALVHEERLPADAWSLAFSGNGLLALPVSDGTVRLYGIAGEVRLLATLHAGLPDPRGVQFSPDGNLLAVGYQSRKSPGEVQVDVFDVQTQALARSFVFNDVEHGNLRNVAWQRDGAALYAAGSGYRGASNFMIKRIAWPQGSANDLSIADNSITDLLPLSDNRVLFATVEPGWGVLKGTEARKMAGPRGAQFYDARVLTVSDDARTVAWRFAPGEPVVSFSIAARDIAPGPGDAKRRAQTESRRIPIRDWENSYRTIIAGRPVAMAPTEIARAVAVLPNASGVLLATSRSLRRIAADGRELWAIPLATEARAVNVSADSRTLVAAMADGTIRWRRAQDGTMLMSLFATRDGQWVLWTESGYFDAGTDSEDLIGWTVNRPGGEQADYYPISRFREKYFRPDVLDRVLVAGPNDADGRRQGRRGGQQRAQ